MNADCVGSTPDEMVHILRQSAIPDTEAERRLHELLGHVSEAMEFDRQSAMVAAARSRGMKTSVDDELTRTRKLLSEREPKQTEVDLEAARRRVAETARDIDSLRERVATHRGRLQAMRERGESEGAESAYRDVIRKLSEAETEHVAALERLDRDRLLARQVRNDREQRLRLTDRLDNLERAARRELRTSIEPILERAVTEVPWNAPPLSDVDDTTAALAILRVSACTLPVVLSCRRFPSVKAAREYLRTPVIQL